MKNFLAALLLPSALFFADSTYADEDVNSNSSLEMVKITIRMSGSYPYGELKPCLECPLRQLPFAPGAQIYLNGQRTTADKLQDGQILEGTVFLRSKPIDSINEIIAK